VSPVCGRDHECLANRCVPAGSEPIDPDTDRVVLEPAAFAVGGATREAAPSTVTLGSERAPAQMLYLRFAPSWKDGREVAGAFLLMSPDAGAPVNRAEVRIDVWTVGGPWSPARVAEGTRPSVGLPRAEGLAIPSPPGLVRIDVTRLARALAPRATDYGLAILAPSGRGPGLTVLTGASGSPPRLEVYLRRPRSRAGTW
jgi:hypothetical protein